MPFSNNFTNSKSHQVRQLRHPSMKHIALTILHDTSLTLRLMKLKPLIAGLRQRWGFHEVRPQAHTFWWLMDSPNKNKPLVMWLQGGPGGSSTAFGNFVEVGPWNLDLKVFKILFWFWAIREGMTYLSIHPLCCKIYALWVPVSYLFSQTRRRG